jgi:hypothetical protein
MYRMWIIFFQLELKTDPESGLPVRKTIKFGTNCDLSDEKKWKPQIQVSCRNHIKFFPVPAIVIC